MKINYQKRDAAKYLSKKTGYSVSYSKKLINILILCLKKNICDGKLILKNFAIFETYEKKQRVGRNPKTKEEFIIKSRKSLKFKPSKYINSLLN